MYLRHFFTATVAALACERAVAVSHGDHHNLNGVDYRWHQLAPDYFHGVPSEEWNETVHKAGLEKWDLDLDDPSKRSTVELDFGGLSERDFLAAACRMTINCALDITDFTIGMVSQTYLTAASYAAAAANTELFKFLTGPFLQNQVTFVAVSVISNPINQVINGKFFSQCSSTGSDADIAAAAISAAVAANPGAGTIQATIRNPDGQEYQFTMTVVPAATTPALSCTTP